MGSGQYRASRITQLSRVDDDGPLRFVELDFGTHVLSELQSAADVFDDGDVPENCPALGREQGRADHRQDSVFRTLDERGSVQGMTATDAVANLLAHAPWLLREAENSRVVFSV